MILLVNNLDRPEIGQSRVVEQVAKCLSNRDGSIKVIRARGAGLWEQAKLVLMVALHCVSSGVGAVYYTPSRATLSILRDLAVYLPCLATRRQLIVHWHGRDIDVYEASSRLHVRAARHVLASAKHLCIAEAQARLVTRVWPEAVVRVLPNAVDEEFVSQVGRYLPERKTAESHKKTVIMLSNLLLSKGVETFCEVAQRLTDRGNWRFVLYGPFGSDYEGTAEDVSAIVQRYSDVVEYRGAIYREAKVKALVDADILLFPSRYASEAMPLVVLEALASECRVIANDIGYLSELLPNKNLELIAFLPGFETDVDAYLRALRHFEKVRVTHAESDTARQENGVNYCERVYDVFSELVSF
jgi:glycosyltransferase involved in cell wall biosynthesis